MPLTNSSQTSSEPMEDGIETSGQKLTPDSRRTLTFVAVAAVSLAITGIFEWTSRPAPIKEFGKVGQEFYPNFTDPTKAESLEVFVFDTDKVQPLDFRVARLDNGRWVIPSHHDYPADAEDRLAKTAASIIGIRRGAMETRWQADHARLGVVDPKQETLNVGDVEGVGKRIVLRGDDDAVLADFIVGKKEDENSNQYYVRRPDEDEVYITQLDIDLSTKFADWIETDLLEIDSWDVNSVTINDYSFDETPGRIQIENSVVSALKRKTSSDPWTLDGLDEATEEVDKDAIRETVDTIADLKIVGVRSKQKGLTPDLKLDREALRAQQDVDILQRDLLTRGFLLQPGEGGDQENLKLVAREGELFAATSDGLRFQVHFGRAFTGSQEELEIGLSSSEEDGDQPAGPGADSKDQMSTKTTEKKTESEDDDPSSTDTSDESDDEDETKSESSKPGRYVFVRVEFDKKYLEEEPVKPVEPEKPAELIEAESKGEQASEDQAGDNTDGSSPEKSSSDEAASETGDAEGKDEASEDEQVDPLAKARSEYEEALKKYEGDLRDYERELEQYNDKIEAGQKKAEELNRRFADWYYVIPGESFDKLRLSREDLVKPKEKETDAEEGAEHEDSEGTPGPDGTQIDAATDEPPAATDAPETTGTTGDAEDS